MPTHFDDYEKHAQRLEKIANNLETDSPEFAALERAGWALAFVTMRHHREFQTFLEEKDRGELTADQTAHLRKLGLL
ncbi:MAG: hypothetical protein ACLQFM_11175 [Terriglobales bacterium]